MPSNPHKLCVFVSAGLVACPRLQSQQVAKPRSELGLSIILNSVQKCLHMLLTGLRYRWVEESIKRENK